jgi:hypothetical protein
MTTDPKAEVPPYPRSRLSALAVLGSAAVNGATRRSSPPRRFMRNTSVPAGRLSASTSGGTAFRRLLVT